MTLETISRPRPHTARNLAVVLLLALSAAGARGVTELVAPASDHVTVGLIPPACLTSDPVLYPCPVVS